MGVLLSGARAVAVGTANFSDPGTIFRIIRELPALCEELGIDDLEAFRGSLKA